MMRVNLGTVEIPDEVRRALRAYNGKPGLATRQEVREFYEGRADAVLTDVVNEWRQRKAEPTRPDGAP